MPLLRRWLITLLALLAPVAAFAESQTAVQGRLNRDLQTYAKMPPSAANAIMRGLANVYYYDTAAELLAASPTEGVIGYALDTDAFYLRAGSSWTSINTTGTLTGANGGTFANGTNNVWTLGENSEDFLLTFGTNKVTLSSSTGVNVLDFGSLVPTLQNGATIANGTDNAIAFGENSEDLILTFGTNSATFSSSTGVSALSLGSLPLTWTNGAQIKNSTDGAITYSETSEDLIQTFTSNTVTLTSSTGVDTLAYTGIGLDAPVVATALGVIRFCGNGPNGTTPTYVGPVTEADYATDMTYSSTACDAKDNTTEATADAPYDPVFAIKPVAMACVTNCGTNDTMTFQLRNATANVTGMSCTVSLTGSAVQCSVRDATPATLAANSTLAIKVSNDIDDNCSAGDLECRVYFTY